MLINISDVWVSARVSHNNYLRKIIDDGMASLGSSQVDKRASLFLEFLRRHLTFKNSCGLQFAIAYHKKLKRRISRYELAQVDALLTRVFNYTRFTRRSLRGWSAYKLCRSSSYRVCPYCHYTLMLVTQEKKKGIRQNLDHWYPQHLYPYLALALDNLIPCCSVCNTHLKGAEDMNEKPFLHPFLDLESLHFRCEKPGSTIVDIITDFENVKDELTFRIEFDPACVKSTNTLELFQLHERYQLLAPDAVKFVGRKTYSDGLEGWFQDHAAGPLCQNQALPPDEPKGSEIRRLGFDRAGYKNEMLGKMYADLYDQFDRTSVLSKPLV
ncbi:hypothetical protein [Pseudomonas syringae group sp. J309-1]|uniref:hypothetical protein n=1 Tax=Pseudomonas syringae group sp. J309-1 TaxID=3079588 RepID=UPI00291414D6|nr:hypothetical protein [Pseudomonas syringae group sp. J309-1]MDU8362441.1 hypothetical protein [Pseudomonas syringae group sp. J309-1]